jgi:hypothetical protein
MLLLLRLLLLLLLGRHRLELAANYSLCTICAFLSEYRHVFAMAE